MKKIGSVLIVTLALMMTLLPAAAFADTSSEAGEPSVTEEMPSEKKQEPVYKNKTGVFYVNGKWRYYKKGVFTKSTGVAKNSKGKWVYVQKGVFKKATGLAQILSNKKWVYVKNGVFNTKKTGLVRRIRGKQWGFVKKGKLVTNPRKIYLTKADEKAGLSKFLPQAYARAIYDKVTNEKMTKKQKLKATFLYVASAKNYKEILARIPYYHGKDWPIVYANDMIRDNGSNCFGFSALFGYLAKLCGCKKVYWCAQSYHGWVEADGLVYDPIFLEVSYQKRLVFGATYKQAIGMNLGTNYDNRDYETFPWMRIQVPAF